MNKSKSYNVMDKINHWIDESPSTRQPKVILKESIKKLSKGSNQYYDDSFCADHIVIKPSYFKLADIIYDWTKPTSACDFGCGNGYIISHLATKGVNVQGIDGSSSILKYVEPNISDSVSIHNLAERKDFGYFDLVISTEVAEHIPKKFSQNFVDNIAKSATKNIIFTAAPPGQKGDGHINCQPKEYWINLFAQRGFKYDFESTEQFIQTVKNVPEIQKNLYWMIENFLLFVPSK